MKPWHFAVLWVALFIVAASTGLELLSYLSYLLLFVAVIAWVQARLTLDGLSIKRALSQSYAHLGDTIELVYELRNDSSFGKLWLEISEESNWPEPLPGRVLSIGGKGKTRKWKVRHGSDPPRRGLSASEQTGTGHHAITVESD
jgi:uncharacterized protein (DUF58 family)